MGEVAEMRRVSPTVGDLMRRSSAIVPASLVSASEASRIATCADILPASLAPVFGYEFRLGEEERVDSAYALFDARRTVEHVDVLVRERGSAAPGGTLGAWQRLHGLLRAWVDPSSIVARGIRVLMLELDTPEGDSPPPALPAPLVFWQSTKGWSPSAEEHLLLLDEAIRILCPEPGAAVARDLVVRAFRRSYMESPGVEPIFGVALSRSPAAVRLQLAGMAPDRILTVARAIAWEGSMSALSRLLDQAREIPGADLVVSFDFMEKVLPRAGIELVRSGPEHSLGPALAYLDRLALVTPRKLRELEALGEERQAFQGDASEVLGRRMSHYKISFIGDRPVQAKGYLKFTFSSREET